MSEVFGTLSGGDAVDDATGDRAWLAALSQAETALARACSDIGLIPLTTALDIGAAAASLAHSPPADFGVAATAAGSPVIPLVAALREQVRARAGDEAAAAVHLGAGGQDILDTAGMLIAQRALDLIDVDLSAAADAAATLALAHRDTPARGGAGEPTTFGAVAAGWGAGLDRAVLSLAELRSRLPAQLGGASGTLAALHPHGPAVQAAFADELGLAAPSGVWHTERSIVAELAAALGRAAATLGAAAGDVVRLARTGEVREAATDPAPDDLAPIAAGGARSAATHAPGLVATVLAAVSDGQHGVAAGRGEWPAMTLLLRAVGAAADRLRVCLVGLQVDEAAMGAALHAATASRPASGGPPLGTGHAAEFVNAYLLGRPR